MITQPNLFKGKYRNLKCGCNSGKKFKNCCWNKLNGYVEIEKGEWVKTEVAQRLRIAEIQ